MNKPRVAFFDFASCEGDQLQIVNLEEDLLKVVGAVDVVSFREAMKGHSDNYDIAFVEGSITRRSDEPRLMEIRKNAKILGCNRRLRYDRRGQSAQEFSGAGKCKEICLWR